MAEIVIGIAASHEPGLVDPSLVLEGTTHAEQYPSVKAGFAEARTLLERARPDAIVIFSSDDFDRDFYDNLPPFLVAVGETAEGPVNEWLKVPRITVQIAGELGRFVVSEGLESGVDFASAGDMALDPAEIVPLLFLTPKWDIPVVPIVINAFAPPLPSLRRCFDVGGFVGKAISRWPERKRVAVVGTGGLSHWVGLPGTGRVNADFDRWFLDCLVGNHAVEVIARYPKAEELQRTAGNGEHEIREWLVVAAALNPRVLAYEAIPGCGTGVMVWSSN
jgi:hypothetical protein